MAEESSRDRTVVVSAPGKVLLAGGYIVLDRKHTGLVFGLSARIHVLAQKIRTSEGVHLSEIVVQSPQFLNATWRYGYHLVENGGGIRVTQLQSGTPVEPNHFVETTLNYVLTYIAEVDKSQASHGFTPASLLVLADNDYYSKPKHHHAGDRPSSSSSAEEPYLPPATPLSDPGPQTHHHHHPPPHHHQDQPEEVKPARPRFRHFGTTLGDAHKTGLGSSAAIVTALTAAMLSHYLPPSVFDLATPEGKRVLHNLAQVAHCSAQGKIGSGFDVASAVYGSCLYRRFSPALLGALPGLGEEGFAVALAALVNDDDADGADGRKWDCEIRKDQVGLPAGVAIRMCDVDCGTQTVGMVKKVHEWRDANADLAARAYEGLQAKVDELARVLKEGKVGEVGGVMRPVRELMRTLGRDCGVPIEPESQEAMLNELEKVEGVLGCVVPGAGGYDAAAMVMRDDVETEKRVRGFLRQWSMKHGIHVRLMKVRGETEGVRKEAAGDFKLWIS
ncbi:phosphomevalonate kinase-like protein [Parathielavia appendiculata]|uniref:Phosphomevalonate kinase n=1 Tax=Parathielavia appendiculata TaxID=2587402 RepID=A0AAN6Z2I9_9PEZI|nr:phosphomevalonate kinase-like protein [Parathielavia appendiculata]